MPENQAHGKTWEKDIALNVFGVTEEEYKPIKNTAWYDLPGELNRLDNGVKISIKASLGNTIDMGDIERLYESTTNGGSVHMVLLKHKQKDPTTKKLGSVTEVDLTNSGDILFKGVTREQLGNLVRMAKAVGKVRPDVSPEQRQYQKDTAYAMRDELHKISGCVRFHLMFYTKNPSRVQGQLYFNQFVREHPERVIVESQSGKFRGGTITEEIVSPPRKRNHTPRQAEKIRLNTLRKGDLQKECTESGLSDKGNMPVLKERLLSHKFGDDGEL